MRYQIVSDCAGRIRLRCASYSFTKEEARSIESYLAALPYVDEASASHRSGGILVLYAPGFRSNVLRAVAGLDPAALDPPESEAMELANLDEDFQNSLLRMVRNRLFNRLFLPVPVRTAITLWRAARYLREGWRCLRRGKITVEVLDAAAVGGSLLQGEFTTASSIMFLLRLSDLLEGYTRKRTRLALTQSLALNVDSVWLLRDGVEVSVPMAQLRVGDRIAVRTGSIIPVDGGVVEGEAMVNQSSMTGEPLPVFKKAGDSVFGGTVLEDGRIVVEVRALGDDTRINKIVELIDQSEHLKANLQGQAERLADRIVPFSFLLAGGVLLFTGNWRKAVSVLLVDYSCAIKLTTPIAVISAMQEASAHKIMVKGGRYLEAMAEADTVVFDKTGTLTVAQPTVSKVVSCGALSREEVLRNAACIEEHFPHSVARAVVRQALEEKLNHEEQHAEVEYIVAHGIATSFDGRRAVIGSHHFVFEDEGIPYPPALRGLVEREVGGDSVIFLAMGGEAVGFICIKDPPREESAAVIRALRRLGVQKTIMLTGDGDATARVVARELGIDEFRSQVLPEDKAAIVAELKARGHKVIMVGDGINDSPALAAADVSVSMRDSSDIAKEVSDVTLLSSNLRELITVRELSQRLLRRIHRNYRFILLFNSGLLALGLFGAITPNASALLHNTSTVALSAGSMRPYLREWEESGEELR